MEKVRVRFAPSPTGTLHVGGARTALFNWFLARRTQGTFILRIEDTDVARSSSESERGVIADLKWLGVDWDEGPGCGGEYGPYRQSERKDVYRKLALQLLHSGKAYRCYCTQEELEERKEKLLSQGESPHYNGHCLNLPEEQRTKLEREGRASSIRFIAAKKEFLLQDVVRGEVRFPSGMTGDFIILRPDGMPTYNFSCVVDDHLMKVTHVIRAEEHLSNTVRQLMLYEALQAEPPEFAHLSLILNRARAKLSKRDGATSVSEFRKLGYLPEAIVNYLALLGWSPGDDREIMSVEELIGAFSLERASKSPAIFDRAKLDWVDGHYIRELDIDHVFRLSVPFFRETALRDAGEDKLKRILAVVRGGLAKLSDVSCHVSIFEEEIPQYEPEAQTLLGKPSSVEVISSAIRLLEGTDVSSDEDAKAWLMTVGQESGKRGKELFMPLRAAITGNLHGRELPQIIGILRRETCLKRLRHAIGGKG